MAWGPDWPITNLTNVRLWGTLSQIPAALREREWARGVEWFPRVSEVYSREGRPVSYTNQSYSGIANSFTASGDNFILTDSGKGWDTPWPSRWYDYVNPDDPQAPRFYDVCIEYDGLNPWGVVRAKILANTDDTLTIEGGPIKDAVAAGQIPSTAALTGRRYVIQRQHTSSHPSLFWHERWPEWPNAQEYAKGTVQLPSAVSISDSRARWKTNEHVGRQLMTLAAGRLKRIPITGNTRNTLTFAPFTPLVSFSDLSSSGPGAIDVHSAAGGFTADMVGKTMLITSGTNFTPGAYAIATYIGPNDVYLDTSATPAGAGTGGSGSVSAPYCDAGADYAVVAAGGKWGYGRRRWVPKEWYRGYGIYGPTSQATYDPRFYSHHPDPDSLLGFVLPTNVAALQIQLLQPNEDNTICVETQVDAFDVDVWTELEEECTAPDRPHSPDFCKTIRSWQLHAELISSAFVEAKDHDNLYGSPNHEDAVPNFVNATWFKAAPALNAYTTTVSSASVSGTPHITFPAITLPAGTIAAEALGMVVHYAILEASGKPVAFGHSYPATTVNGLWGSLTGKLASLSRIDLRGPTPGEAAVEPPDVPPYPPSQEWVDSWVGKTLVISLGWDRAVPREYRYHYAKTVFVSPSGDPPSESDPGFYLTRPPSTRYVEYSELGTVMDTATPLFVDGDKARYAGDRWDDPTTSDSVHDGADADTPYRDRLFTGVMPPEFGRATSGTAASLRDTTRSAQNRWWTAAPPRTETGTASGGSTTSLSDTSKAASAFWDGTTGRWAGFVVEVEIDGVWHRRPIASQSGTTLSWSEALPASASGKPYRIREPAELNRWKGRTVRIQLPQPVGVIEREITHSDDDTLYFASVAADLATLGLTEIPAGASYKVREAQPGQVFQWSASAGKWVKPTGADPRGAALEPAVQWHDNQTENLPTVVRRFGRFCKGDYVTPALLNQIRDGINKLVWTKAAGTWNYTHIEPYNWKQASGTVNENIDGDTFADAKALADDRFENGIHGLLADTNILPGVSKGLYNASAFPGHLNHTAEIVCSHNYAYVPSTATTRIAHATDAYVYTSTDEDDEGERDEVFTGTIAYRFQPFGYNVFYRKWGKIASGGPSTDWTTSVKIGDYDINPAAWPAEPSGENDANIGSWSAVGSPLIVYRWNVPGGMTYVP